MYLLDTDIVIWILRGNKKYIDLVLKLKDQDSLSISVITIAEIYKNIFPSELLAVESFFNEMEIWNITSSIAKQAGLYFQQYSKKLKNLNLTDCLIAATVKNNNLKLVSLDAKHFPMTDIAVLK